MTKFDPTKPVQTRDGREAEICWTDGSKDYPFGGWYRDTSGAKDAATWSLSGTLFSRGSGDSLDLINIPEKPTTIERWARIVCDPAGGHYPITYYTKREAEAEARKSTVAIVHIPITFTPGEGLDE